MGAHLQNWMLAARPKTLWAATAPVVIGTAMALRDGVVHIPAAVLALLGALLIQIGTNFHNDYRDFETGADTQARKGPTRVVLAGLISASAMRRATFFAFAAAVAAGAYLMWRGGWPIVVIGACSILFGILYTGGRYSLKNLGLADLFVFIFFGPVAVAGTYYVQALAWPLEVWLAGIAPGVLSIAILMVNNVRDIEEDRAHRKRTLVVRFGRPFGIGAYVCCLLAAAAVPFLLHVSFRGPLLAGIAAVIVPLAFVPVRTLVTTPVEEGRKLNAVLAATGQLLLVYSLGFSFGWIVG